MSNVVIFNGEECTNFGHTETVFCVDVVSCHELIIDGLFVECGNEWNCNLGCKGDCEYFTPLPEDGNIQLQLNLLDPGRKNPTTNEWLTVTLCDSNGNDVTSDISLFTSRWVHGYCKPNNFQTYEIDVAKIAAMGITCFSFRFDAEQLDVPICTHTFKIEKCVDLIELEGIGINTDCWNNCYGLSETTFVGTENFAYSNKIYIKGGYKFYGVENGDDGEITEYSRVYMHEKIPPYMMRYLMNKIISAPDAIIVNGEVWSGSNTKFSVLEGYSMFLNVLEFSRECENNKNGEC